MAKLTVFIDFNEEWNPALGVNGFSLPWTPVDGVTRYAIEFDTQAMTSTIREATPKEIADSALREQAALRRFRGT